jgi:hypothetical protein
MAENGMRPRFDPDFPEHDILNRPQEVHAPQARFVSSVPTASILNNFRGMWDNPLPTSGADPNLSSSSRPRGVGVGGSEFSSRTYGNGVPGSFDGSGVEVPSPSLLGTSNASAAFLPGRVQRHQQANGYHADSNTMAGTASSLADPPSMLARGFNPNSDLALSSRFYAGAMPSYNTNGGSQGRAVDFNVPNDTAYYGLHDASSNTSRILSHHHKPNPTHSSRHPQQHYNGQMALSPGALALRSHEPGQSLPQGLAAGLSRLHLVPAGAPIASPDGTSSSYMGMSPSGVSGSVGTSGFGAQYGSWLKNGGGTGTSPLTTGLGVGGVGSYGAGGGGSYGGVASPPRFTSGPLGGGGAIPNGNANGPGYASLLSRGGHAISSMPGSGAGTPRPGAGSSWLTSPLSRPSMPDDDAVFDMDA